MKIARASVPTDPLTEFERRRHDLFPVLLESAASDRRYGRISIVASNPTAVLMLEGDRLSLFEGGDRRTLRDDPFQAIERLAGRGTGNPELPFSGGLIGWIGYDLNRFVERVPQTGPDPAGLPPLFLGLYEEALCIDHHAGRAWNIGPDKPAVAAMDRARAERLFGRPCRDTLIDPVPESNFTREAYEDAIRTAKDHIAAGEIYEVNLSQRFSVGARASAIDLYRRLRAASPAWYASVISLGRRFVVGSSPEEFMSLADGRLRTRPIKGTRPRGVSAAVDARLRDELEGHPKDDAELAMIVDLSRNDVGRVSRFGSVRVDDPKSVETHATVHHLSASVEGRLRDDAGLAETLRALFPGGSVTGAPKIRAMEIIDALEPDRRGLYTGALGCIGFGGRVTLSMMIRTAVFDGRRIHFQTGGAIVADSDPSAEYEETLVKAEGFRRAISNPI